MRILTSTLGYVEWMCSSVVIHAGLAFFMSRTSEQISCYHRTTLASRMQQSYTPLYAKSISPASQSTNLGDVKCASASRWASETALETQGGRRDPWAEFHAGKTRQYIDRTMATGQDIFHVLQACILLSWYFYTEGRWVEVGTSPYLIRPVTDFSP